MSSNTTFTTAAHMILITLTLSLASGCTTGYVIDLSETKSKKVTSVVFSTVIKGVELQSGETFIFNNEFGLYDSQRDLIRGVTERNSQIEMAVNNIERIVYQRNSREGAIVFYSKPETFKREVNHGIWYLVDGKTIRPQTVFSFNSERGKYNAANNTIDGYSRTGEFVEISIDDLCYATSTKLSILSSLYLIGGPYVGVIILRDVIEIINDLL